MVSMMRKVLLTGAAGFIGSHLTELLVRQGYRVRALYHYNSRNDKGWLEDLPWEVQGEIECLAGDVRDPHAMVRAASGVEAIFHLASLVAIPYSYRAPSSYVDTNVHGTLNVLQAALDNDVSLFVHTSTSETYGTAQRTPMDESHPLVGQSPYSASKIAADKLVESFHLSFGLPVATIRPFNTFGPRQSARAVIPTIITQALSGKDEIRLGALSPIRDMNFVTDTAAGFAAVLSSPDAVGRTINLGSGKGVSIGELAIEILDLCESEARIVTDEERLRPDRSEVLELVCDPSLAKKILGWESSWPLRDGLDQTIEWIRSNPHVYRDKGYVI